MAETAGCRYLCERRAAGQRRDPVPGHGAPIAELTKLASRQGRPVPLRYKFVQMPALGWRAAVVRRRAIETTSPVPLPNMYFLAVIPGETVSVVSVRSAGGRAPRVVVELTGSCVVLSPGGAGCCGRPVFRSGGTAVLPLVPSGRWRRLRCWCLCPPPPCPQSQPTVSVCPDFWYGMSNNYDVI